MGSRYQYFVYILASHNDVLYIGVTNDFERRLYEHRNPLKDSFTARYNVTKLVYYECFADIRYAIMREKQLKGWKRIKKLELIWSVNPTLGDWTEQWVD